MELHLHLRPDDKNPLFDLTHYRHLVGSLVYLTITRHDIVFVIHVLSQFVSAPTSVHYTHLLRVFLYLRATRHMVFSTRAAVLSNCRHILMLPGLVILLIVVLSPAFASS